MFYQLPPVGNPINISSEEHPEALLQSVFAPYKAEYFASGTAALAAAIIASVRIKAIEQPEVIFPAYGCPDLISAAMYAGVKPVLVDLEPDRPWMDLEQLLAHTSSSTVAIVAASLFGISERIALLRPIAEQVGAVIIEDSAQAFPGKEEKDIWQGDLVVLSFGRGKPVNLLGGGAVLFREKALGDLLSVADTVSARSKSNQAFFHLKALMFNQIISPRLYWLPQSLPFLNLGETRYHPLPGINAMDQTRLEMLPANIAAYLDNGMKTQITLSEMLQELDPPPAGLIDLPKVCQVLRQRKLLRYPLLVEALVRDRLYQQLHRNGSGSSVMYPTALPGIPGLETLLGGQGPFPAAEAFASCVLTLPTHGKVGLKDIANIRSVMVLG